MTIKKALIHCNKWPNLVDFCITQFWTTAKYLNRFGILWIFVFSWCVFPLETAVIVMIVYAWIVFDRILWCFQPTGKWTIFVSTRPSWSWKILILHQTNIMVDITKIEPCTKILRYDWPIVSLCSSLNLSSIKFPHYFGGREIPAKSAKQCPWSVRITASVPRCHCGFSGGFYTLLRTACKRSIGMVWMESNVASVSKNAFSMTIEKNMLV